jgi:hypothetical protein
MKYECGVLAGWYSHAKPEVLEEKPIPSTLLPPHGLAWDRNWVLNVTGQPLIS